MPPRLFQVRTAQTHTQSIRSMSIGPRSGRVYATGGDDCFLNLYSVTDENPIYHFGPYSSSITCSSFHYSEDFIAFGTQTGLVQILDLDSRKTLASFNLKASHITTIDYHPANSDYISVGDSEGHVFILCAQERNPIQKYQAHRGSVTCVKFSPEGSLLASSGSDRLIRIFQIFTGECLNTIRINCPQFLSLDFHPTEMLLAGCSDDRSIHVFSFEVSNVDIGSSNTNSGNPEIFQQLITNELKGSFIIGNASPHCIKFSKDGKVLAACSSSVLSVFKTFSPDFVDHMQIGQKKVHDIQLYSTCVAVASSDGNIGTIIFAKTDDFRLLKKEKIKLINNNNNNNLREKVKSGLQNKVIDGSNLVGMKKTIKNRDKEPKFGLADLQPKPPALGPAANDAIYRGFKAKRPNYLEMLESRKTKFSYLFDQIKTKGSAATINEIATTGDSAWEFVSIIQIRPQTVTFENAAKCFQVMKFAFDDDPNLTVNTIGLVLDIIGPTILSSLEQIDGGDKQKSAVSSDELIEVSEAVKSIAPYIVEAANNNIEEAKAILETWKSILY